MLKLVVLCVFLAAVAAEPGFISYIPSPVSTYSSVLNPAVTTYSQQASVIHPALSYSSLPYTHFIKKRSAPAFSYPISYISPYSAATPLLTSTYTTPFINSAPVLSHASYGLPTAHLIKKRSAPLLATTYYANSAYASALPYSSAALAPYTLTNPIIAPTPLISHAPVAAPAIHLIKKRSPGLLAANYYSAQPYGAAATLPLAYSTPYVQSASLISQPITTYSSVPTTYTQFIKK